MPENKQTNMSLNFKIQGIILLLVLFTSNFLQAQDNSVDQATKMLEEGRFEEALPIFKAILSQSPGNEKLNYFVGVCLVETGNYTTEALKSFEIAKSKIPEALFYIGKYYHSQSNWNMAAQYYEQFKITASVKSVQSSPVEELLSLNKQNINPFAIASPSPQIVEVSPPALTQTSQTPTAVRQTPVQQSQQSVQVVQQTTQPQQTTQSAVQQATQPVVQQPQQAAAQPVVVQRTPQPQQATVQPAVTQQTSPPQQATVQSTTTQQTTQPQQTSTQPVVQTQQQPVSKPVVQQATQPQQTSAQPVVQTPKQTTQSVQQTTSQPIAQQAPRPQQTQPVIPQRRLDPNIPSELMDTLISFQVNAIVYYNYIDQFRTESSRNTFIQGWNTDKKLNLKLAELNDLRNKYASLIGAEQEAVAKNILALEQETMLMYQQVQETLQKANVQEAEYWNKADAVEVHNFRQKVIRVQDSLINARAKQRMILTEIKQPVVIIPDTLVADTTVVSKVTDISKVVYKVLIGAYKNAPPQSVQDSYKKLSVLRKIDKNVDESGITIYTVGELNSYEDADLLKTQIQQEGIKTASVATFLDGKRIPMEKVKELLSK